MLSIVICGETYVSNQDCYRVDKWFPVEIDEAVFEDYLLFELTKPNPNRFRLNEGQTSHELKVDKKDLFMV